MSKETHKNETRPTWTKRDSNERKKIQICLNRDPKMCQKRPKYTKRVTSVWQLSLLLWDVCSQWAAKETPTHVQRDPWKKVKRDPNVWKEAQIYQSYHFSMRHTLQVSCKRDPPTCPKRPQKIISKETQIYEKRVQWPRSRLASWDTLPTYNIAIRMSTTCQKSPTYT